ncbi:glycosylhydrolase-like jelly roll fold domain-containing protein [Algoriphagus boritolerans]|uniref:glycosylhydrolase-like jelly roll fold domain-containing protein n=1 Tax=Algoriphagus boritolerans TaxID=308111 RepID=UPI003A102F6E
MECWQNGKYTIVKNSGNQMQAIVENIPTPYPINGAWQVEFDPKWGGPGKVEFPELISWTEHNDPGIKYYSGKGKYQKTIIVKDEWMGDGKNIYLDIGDVGEIAEIFINGNSAGVVWKPPFRVNITGQVKLGENELKIEVMNLWVNRLTGDKDLPETERFTKTNIRSDGGSWLENYTEWHVELQDYLDRFACFFPKRLKLSSE